MWPMPKTHNKTTLILTTQQDPRLVLQTCLGMTLLQPMHKTTPISEKVIANWSIPMANMGRTLQGAAVTFPARMP
ncbi:hypothetical protein Ahy_A10g050916 isoform B [Arachis hypogaea]|uniref:Uncharacterized protein n=1 Tax=Arachis hypogaea TaxID=3818 RepID=A0A445BAX1_ARAHY|nr:hypothetical protein Ahy_A10g050916 isoform B [Arachis hypogaea]